MYNSYAMNYFPYQAANIFDGTRFPSSVENNSAAYAFWCRALYQKLSSIVEFELPEEWMRAADFFESILFGRGFLTVFDHAKYGKIFQPCHVQGYDIYYQPTACNVANPHIRITRSLEIGKDCSLIKLTPDFHGVVDIVAYYAEKLASLDGAINMNIINSKFGYVFGAKNKAAARSVQMIFDKLNKGEPLIVYDKELTEGLGEEEPFEFIDRSSLKNGYITSDLLKDFKTCYDNFLEEIGIPTIPMEKKERMITDEANSRNSSTSAKIRLWKEELTRTVEETNKMFDLNIKFKFPFLDQIEEASEEKPDPDANIGKELKTWEYQS